MPSRLTPGVTFFFLTVADRVGILPVLVLVELVVDFKVVAVFAAPGLGEPVLFAAPADFKVCRTGILPEVGLLDVEAVFDVPAFLAARSCSVFFNVDGAFLAVGFFAGTAGTSFLTVVFRRDIGSSIEAAVVFFLTVCTRAS